MLLMKKLKKALAIAQATFVNELEAGIYTDIHQEEKIYQVVNDNV